MDLNELRSRLEREYFNPDSYHIGENWFNRHDVYCLVTEGTGYEIFYAERGEKGSVLGRYADESVGCQAFYDILSKEVWSRAHCVGFFVGLGDADQACRKLGANGVRFHRDCIPYGGRDDLRHRVFVYGADVVAARGILGTSDEMVR